MLVAVLALDVRLRGHFQIPPQVFPIQAFAYAADVEKDLATWTPERGLRPARLQRPREILQAPASEAICYIPGRKARSRPILLAHPALVPTLFGAPALPVAAPSVMPPRIAADLVMEQGSGPDSSLVQTLQEDLATAGGLSHVAFYERGPTRILTVKRTNRPLAGEQSSGRYVAFGAGIVTEERRESLRELLAAGQYHLRLVAAIEEPWPASYPGLWDEWSPAG